jgi:ABC-2 type transport system ATP-binding protein
MPQVVLSVEKLTKRYKSFLAVDNISFNLHQGEILGLLGPNGAGKTTTIQMLLGLTEPDSGKITYFDKELSRNHEYCLSRINFASAYSRLQGKMTVRQNLVIYAGFYGVANPQKKIAELAELLEIEPQLDEVYWHLSSGQETRVNLAKSLLNEPKIILMDEPTASLDPDIVNKIIDLIRRLQSEKKVAILFTSHNMEEVSRLCGKVMFMNHGQIVVTDTPLNLSKQISKAHLEVSFDGSRQAVSQYLRQQQLVHQFIRPELVSIEVDEEQIPGVLFDIKDAGAWITNIDVRKPTLEDVFLEFSRRQERGTK